MKYFFSLITIISLFPAILSAQTTVQSGEIVESAHSILPVDGVIEYLPKDSSYFRELEIDNSSRISFFPKANFFFRPEATGNYKEAGFGIDTGHLNFYLRGDFGGKISLPKNIDMVFNLQSYGVYTRSFGPLDPDMSLYEAYVDMKKLDRQGKLSLRFGRFSLGKYGTEMLVGDDDFTRGRSFESIRLRYKTNRSRSDWMWVQLYQQAPDSANFEWNHPIFLGNFNTFDLSDNFGLDANLVYIIDQFNSGYRTSVFMPNARLFGNFENIRFSAEMIFQTGSAKGIISNNIDGKVSATAFEVGAGYHASNRKFAIDGAYYRASGDDDTTDDELKSYNVLWQNEHRRFGFIDAFKGSNVQAITLHLNWNVSPLWDIGAHAVSASVLEKLDRSPGIATLPLQNLDDVDSSIGVGGDIYVNHYFSHFLNMQLSGSVFTPGEYFTAVNTIDETMFRVYLLLALRI